jgi:hypothetical protein
MFASKIVREMSVDGETVVIRKLNHAVLERARDAKSAKGARSLRDFGGEVLKVLQSNEYGELKAKKEEDPNAPRVARYNSFDRTIVLSAGIVSWTAGVNLSADTIEDLDEATAQTLYEAIVDLSLPPLDPKVAEAQEKNA